MLPKAEDSPLQRRNPALQGAVEWSAPQPAVLIFDQREASQASARHAMDSDVQPLRSPRLSLTKSVRGEYIIGLGARQSSRSRCDLNKFARFSARHDGDEPMKEKRSASTEATARQARGKGAP